MPEAHNPTSPQTDDLPQDEDLPPGDHALEVAARRGLGPLSPLGRRVWHGDARPCVSCGQLVHREDDDCDNCGQDLTDEMIERMLAHAGPWYVLEHVRPFPGVTLERIIRQIRRGVIGETSIVRGPETGHQWRFAGETPGLCRYFDRCWQCHEKVEAADTHCPSCLSDLRFRYDQVGTIPAKPPAATVGPPSRRLEDDVTIAVRPQPKAPSPVARVSFVGAPPGVTNPVPAITEAEQAEPPEELRELTMALREVAPQETQAHAPDEPRIAGLRPFWVLSALLIAVIAILLYISHVRQQAQTATERTPVPAKIQTPHSPSK